MRRELLEKLHGYFADMQEKDENELNFLTQLTEEMNDHDIAFVNKAALERHGYDTTDVTDDDLSEIASQMGDSYCDSRFSHDLVCACDELGIPKKENKR